MVIYNLAQVQARDADHVHVTILANVLHEVPVSRWLDLFKNVVDASQPGARLLVIEDQEPRVGELPHADGFIVLERAEWRALVDCEIGERRREHGGRSLTAFEIPVASLASAGPHLSRTLGLVQQRCIREVNALRRAGAASARAGRKHAFYASLHLNATLALSAYPPPALARS